MVHLLTREELTTLVDKDKGIWLLTQNPGKPHDKEVSTNNCCKFMAIFIVFPGFCLKQLQQLFSDNS